MGGAGPWAAAAAAVAPDALQRTAIDTAGFRFAKLKTVRDVNFLPGVVKYGDLPALLALAAPQSLWLAGEGSTIPPLVAAAYRAAGKADALTAFDGPAEKKEAAAVDWLLK